MEPTASGVLAKTPLAHLIIYCAEKRLGGALIFRPEGDEDAASADVVTLVDGWPAKIRTRDATEHLGRILVEVGAIDDVTYNESLHALTEGHGLHGDILLRSGKIDLETLERGLRTQIARKVGSLFARPPTTTYAYYEGADFLARYGGPELFPVDPMPILLTGIRVYPSMPHVDAALARLARASLRLRAETDLDRFEMNRREREVFESLRRTPLSLAELEQSSGLESRTIRLLVYALLLTKQVEPTAVISQMPPGARGVMTIPPGSSQGAAPASGEVPRPTSPVSGGSSSSTASPPPGPTETRRASPPVPAGPSAGRTPLTPATTLPPTPSMPPRDPNAPASPVTATWVSRIPEIRARAKEIEGQNYFEMLGLTSEAVLEEVKNAYFALAKVWHPDRLQPELAALRPEVTKIFGHLAQAYQTLTDSDRRARYEQLVAQGGGTPADQAEVDRVVEAANAFQRAEFFVGKGAVPEAEAHLARALELEPKEPDYVALWCWIQANKPKRKETVQYEDLLKKLDEIIEEWPRSEKARFYRGMILKASGRLADAVRDFRFVAENNPRNTDAIREVRLYTMRSERDRKAKDDITNPSLLGRFMKKK